MPLHLCVRGEKAKVLGGAWLSHSIAGAAGQARVHGRQAG